MNHIDKHMANYIHISKYARWLDDKGRRETWDETVDRYVQFFTERFQGNLEDPTLSHDLTEMLKVTARDGILDFKVMPSMRCLMTAGPALQKDHAAGYNCWGKAIDHQRCFDELFYLLMCGGGTGFSVERQFINKLPDVPEELYESDTIIKVPDSRIGWASSLKQLLALLYGGAIPRWDLSGVRPAGSRLKCFGGRASGPEPLDQLFRFTVFLFKKAKGRKLNSIECHDLQCKIADTVIMGSVRRSATISVSNLTDDRMRRAKMGEWRDAHPHRALANNSVGYTEKPDLEAFTKEFRSIYKSKAGERGIINKEALNEKARQCGRDITGRSFLLNPCGEAILDADGQACNLTEVIARYLDSLKDLKEKVRIAAFLGTIQSTLTDFRYIRKQYQKNCEEERLLGISITGVMDHPVLSGAEGDKKLVRWLKELKEVARETNVYWSNRLGINESKQLTLVKPSGTVSKLCGTSSGMHPRFGRHYINRVTQDPKDPLTHMLLEQNVPYVVKGDNYLFEFPMKAPDTCVTNEDIDAIGQLELWKIYQEHWCDGNPSQSIYYTDDTFLDVQAWVYKHWDIVGGLSFFPVDDSIYENPPNEEITEKHYEELVAKFPDIDWSKLSDFEEDDHTTSSQELACAGGSCEL